MWWPSVCKRGVTTAFPGSRSWSGWVWLLPWFCRFSLLTGRAKRDHIPALSRVMQRPRRRPWTGRQLFGGFGSIASLLRRSNDLSGSGRFQAVDPKNRYAPG